MDPPWFHTCSSLPQCVTALPPPSDQSQLPPPPPSGWGLSSCLLVTLTCLDEMAACNPMSLMLFPGRNQDASTYRARNEAMGSTDAPGGSLGVPGTSPWFPDLCVLPAGNTAPHYGAGSHVYPASWGVAPHSC